MAGRLKPNASDLKWAEGFYDDFHWGDAPDQLTRAKVPELRQGEVLAVLGELVEVVYLASKDGDTAEFAHEFQGRRPQLCFSRTGALWICGGSYRVTARGIVG